MVNISSCNRNLFHFRKSSCLQSRHSFDSKFTRRSFVEPRRQSLSRIRQKERAKMSYQVENFEVVLPEIKAIFRGQIPPPPPCCQQQKIPKISTAAPVIRAGSTQRQGLATRRVTSGSVTTPSTPSATTDGRRINLEVGIPIPFVYFNLHYQVKIPPFCRDSGVSPLHPKILPP